MMRWIILLLFVGFSVSCVPVNVKKGCRKQMNDCLRNCQKVYQANVATRQDRRTPCEQNCHQLCWRKSSAQPVTPEDKEAMKKMTP